MGCTSGNPAKDAAVGVSCWLIFPFVDLYLYLKGNFT